VRAVLVILGVVLGASLMALVLGAGRILVRSDPLPEHADAIVMLAGSISDRVLEAADLYRAGVAPRVVVTRERVPRGDWALRARGVRLPESAEQTVAALQALGVPASAITVIPRRTIFLDKTKNGDKRQVPLTSTAIKIIQRY